LGLFAWLASGLLVSFSLVGSPSAGQRTFSSPEEAARALARATEAGNKAELHEIFGTACDDFLSGDETQDRADLKSFARAASQRCSCVPEGKGSSQQRALLEIGEDRWPFPVPLVRENGRWFFDTNAGREEILNRHVGKDELHAIGICRAFVGGRERDGWALASLVAQAQKDEIGAETTGESHGCHGYVFKIIPSRSRKISGRHATALLAYPKEWGRSGVMTFVATSDGKVYQSDLGSKTAEIASTMGEYKPSREWKLVRDSGVRDWQLR